MIGCGEGYTTPVSHINMYSYLMSLSTVLVYSPQMPQSVQTHQRRLRMGSGAAAMLGKPPNIGYLADTSAVKPQNPWFVVCLRSKWFER